jgi:hypothetical protein
MRETGPLGRFRRLGVSHAIATAHADRVVARLTAAVAHDRGDVIGGLEVAVLMYDLPLAVLAAIQVCQAECPRLDRAAIDPHGESRDSDRPGDVSANVA